MKYYLGVDAGGTKTEFVLGNETIELGRVRAGTIKRMKAAEQVTESNLTEALKQLSAITGISMHLVSRCCIGTAGETVPLVVDWLRGAFGTICWRRAAPAGRCGNRSRCIIFREARCAGSGRDRIERCRANSQRKDRYLPADGAPAMADQGSGHFIGLEALRRGFLAIDQRRTTSVLENVRDYWKLDSLGNLIEFANANPAPDFSRLVPLVVRLGRARR